MISSSLWAKLQNTPYSQSHTLSKLEQYLVWLRKYFVFFRMVELLHFVVREQAGLVALGVGAEFIVQNGAATVIFGMVIHTLFGIVPSALVGARRGLEETQVQREIH